MICELSFTNEMLYNAEQKAKSLGSIRNSILRGSGNVAGFLGEEILAPYINAQIISGDEGDDKYSYDLITPDGLCIEVKTKRRTVKPLDTHDASVAHTSTHQKPDIYAFMSIECGQKIQSNPIVFKGVRSAWLCGFMKSEEYMRRAKFLKKGYFDMRNNFTAHCDMYNLMYKFLFDSIEEAWNSKV